jgi:hypothetical protein
MKINLFSLVYVLQKGLSLHSEGTSMILEKEGKKVYFDTKIPMGSSFLIAAKIKVVDDRGGAMVVSDRKEIDNLSGNPFIFVHFIPVSSKSFNYCTYPPESSP